MEVNRSLASVKKTFDVISITSVKLTAEADLSAASAVWSSGAVGTAGCAAEGKLLFVHGVVVSHLDLVDIL